MEDLRYPIGPLEFKGRTLLGDERAAMIDTIDAHPANMRAAVAGLNDEQLDTPYRADGWTVRQVVHHVVDSHLNSYQRFKLALTEERPTVRTYREGEWAELPEAKSAPVEVSLALLEALHVRWVMMLRGMAPSDFEKVLDHPEIGDITADQLLEIYGWHCPHHEGHITALRDRMGW
jgi:uncharacterized damage-inducible protein DinB